MANEPKTKDSEPKFQSLECPRCRCRHMYTVETKSTPHRIIRTRQCRHCGRRIKTYEQFSGHAAVFHKTTTDTTSASNGGVRMPVS